jgi:hypothetical protein
MLYSQVEVLNRFVKTGVIGTIPDTVKVCALSKSIANLLNGDINRKRRRYIYSFDVSIPQSELKHSIWGDAPLITSQISLSRFRRRKRSLNGEG